MGFIFFLSEPSSTEMFALYLLTCCCFFIYRSSYCECRLTLLHRLKASLFWRVSGSPLSNRSGRSSKLRMKGVLKGKAARYVSGASTRLLVLFYVFSTEPYSLLRTLSPPHDMLFVPQTVSNPKEQMTAPYTPLQPGRTPRFTFLCLMFYFLFREVHLSLCSWSRCWCMYQYAGGYFSRPPVHCQPGS